MACDLTTTLAAACTSGIGKLQSRIQLLQTWAQLVCSGGTPCVPLDAPVATGATSVTANGFTANWTAVPGAVTYYLDVSTDPLFGSFVLGYNGLAVSAPTVSQAVIQIGMPTLYYRVRASALPSGNLTCPSSNSNVITVGVIVESNLTTFQSSSTVLTTFTTSSVTPAANSLVLCFVFGGPAVTSVTGNGLTWELVYDGYTPQSTVNADSISVYRAMGAAPTAGGVTANLSGAAAAGVIIQVQQYTGVDTSGTNGSGAIGQAFGNYINATTIAPLNTNARNAIVGAAILKANPTGASLEASWVEDLNLGQTPAAVSISAFIAHRLISTDNSFTTSMAAGTFSLAIEIVCSGSVQAFITPSALANLEVWSRASDGAFQDAAKSVPCTNGTSVYTWDNQGNTAVTADFVNATALTRPTWHLGSGGTDYDRIIFFGTSRLTNAYGGSGLQPFTLIFIGLYTSATSTDAPLIWNETAAVQLGVVAAGSLPRCFAGTPVASARAFSAGICIGGFNVNVDDYLYVNNRNTTTSTAFGLTQWTNGIVLGELLGFGMNGSYYEAMYFSRILTTAEVCQIQNYAKNRYGFTSY